MKKAGRRRPSGAMIVAVIALVMAMTGGAIAAKKQLKLGALTDGAKNKTVGVGKLTYVSTTTTLPNDPDNAKTVTAACPSGLKVIGGGIKGERPDEDFIFDSYPTSFGWSGRVFAQAPGGVTSTFTVTAICASSRAVTGAPPTS